MIGGGDEPPVDPNRVLLQYETPRVGTGSETGRYVAAFAAGMLFSLGWVFAGVLMTVVVAADGRVGLALLTAALFVAGEANAIVLAGRLRSRGRVRGLLPGLWLGLGVGALGEGLCFAALFASGPLI